MPPRLLAALLVVALAIPVTARADAPLDLREYGDQLLTTGVGPNKAPRVGRARVLVVPVDFGQGANFSTFLPFFDPDPAAGYTFSNFFRRQSRGLLDVDTFIAAPVVFASCPVPVAGCRFDDLADAGHAIEAARLVFERVLATLPVPLSHFDLGGEGGEPDGWVDGVILLIPSWWGGIAPPIWPFLDVSADGVQVGHASISRLDREIVLHEFGHNLGACDQYLWDFEHSLMSWCDGCSLDVHTRARLGWVDVIDVAPDTEVLVDLGLSVDDGPVLRLGAPPEYFLVEHRAPHHVGARVVDAGLDGVLVVHVDEAVAPPFLAQSDYPKHRALLESERPSGGANRTWFVPGDTLEPAADHAPTSATRAWRDSNRHDGARTGIRVAVEGRGPASDGTPRYRLRARGPSAPDAAVTFIDLTGPTSPDAEPSGDVAPGGDAAPRGTSGGCSAGQAPPSAAWIAWCLALLALATARSRPRRRWRSSVVGVARPARCARTPIACKAWRRASDPA